MEDSKSVSSASSSKKRKRDSPKYYAVRLGRKPGVYHTYEEVEDQVKGFAGAERQYN
jgi:ribonuclease HI